MRPAVKIRSAVGLVTPEGGVVSASHGKAGETIAVQRFQVPGVRVWTRCLETGYAVTVQLCWDAGDHVARMGLLTSAIWESCLT